MLAGHCAQAHDTHDEKQNEEDDSDNQDWHTNTLGDDRLCPEGTHGAVTAITLNSDNRLFGSNRPMLRAKPPPMGLPGSYYREEARQQKSGVE